jgi:SAM-dependent methyltransferase
VRLNDPAIVRDEYASELGLKGRRAAYRYAEGPDAPELAFEAVAEVRPRRVLEVGCGPGELSERIARELGAEVVALDISPRMVELARARGVDARVGDVQKLVLADREFDCAVAAWVLFHAQDVEQALGELARVLRNGGRLVAATNDVDHHQELRELLGLPSRLETSFSGANGEGLLLRHFARVERRDAAGVIHFPDRDAVASYVDASIALYGSAELPPLSGPLPVRFHAVVFVAEKA